MEFEGISKDFFLTNQAQYDTIGRFWDEMALLYGLENLQGLGYCWKDGKISYAIGLKEGRINGCNLRIQLPDSGWTCIKGQTACLKQLYDEIYQAGPLRFEIETFFEDGSCSIRYYR